MHDHASHNRAYALVWNEEQQAWVPAPETSRARGKRSGGRAITAMVSLLASAAAYAIDPGAHPTGGNVVAGQAQISQSGNATTINQSTAKTVINWQSFDIGSQSTVDFLQPSSSSVALNRVVTQDPTQIFGSLHANGQVFIVNPNGVLFGVGAQVSAAGILASTRDIANADFKGGNYVFSGSGAGTVVNQGSLTAAQGGYVVLMGAQVVNDGTLTARGGDARLVAADQVTLRVDGAGLTLFQIDRGTLDSLVANHGVIKADGGRIYLTADALDALAKSQVNNTGVIEAQTVGNDQGTIVLQGDMGVGRVAVGGTLDASAPHGGNGGSIETSAAHVDLAGAHHVTTLAASGRTGTWLVDPTDFVIGAGGDETAADLETALLSTDVEIRSIDGASSRAGSGNISVNDAVSWSANRLTLTAQANIVINAGLNGSGTAALTLNYGQGAVAAGNTSRYLLAPGATVSLPDGQNLDTQLGSDGAVLHYQVISTLGSAGSATGTDLQGIAQNRSGLYALGGDIDASPTTGWNSGQGFAPIGHSASGQQFTGAIEGLGHSIAGLTINRPGEGEVGLIGYAGMSAVISDVNLTGATVSGINATGALIGKNAGTVLNSSSTGGRVYGYYYTGGLIGAAEVPSVMQNLSVNGDVNGYSGTGGLIGLNQGTVGSSTSRGTVSGVSDTGGSIGFNFGTVTALTSYGTVTATGDHAGGLVGVQQDGEIDGGLAFGGVSGVNDVGGLVGIAYGATILSSSAQGNVTGSGASAVGGLVGSMNNDGSTLARIDSSDATGAVAGTQTGSVGTAQVGGLVGYAEGSITNSSAGGNVTATGDDVGGLAGKTSAAIVDSYAGRIASGVVSTVDGGTNVGGLVGELAVGGSISGTSYAVGNVGTTRAVNAVGGLVGLAHIGTTITGASATGNVTATGNGVGGLVGTAAGLAISSSTASGDVTASGAGYVGGLVGNEDLGTGSSLGSISDSSASGAVHGTNTGYFGTGDVGGLGGYIVVPITNSSATGNVTATGGNVGGLVGAQAGTIAGSFATGNVTGQDYTGGLVGGGTESISASHASGNVSGQNYTGGLVGGIYADGVAGAVSNSTASGNVSGQDNVGGLIGSNVAGNYSTPAATDIHAVMNSSSSGTVSGHSYVGGLFGYSNTMLDGAVDRVTTASVVSATGSAVGGLVGQNDAGGTVRNYTTTLAVAAAGGGTGIGGVVGLNSGGQVMGVHAANTVSSDGTAVGGIVGSNTSSGVVVQSYATNTVTGVTNVGGVAGANDGGTLDVTYAAGTVNGDTGVGGLVGEQSGGSPTGTASSYSTATVNGVNQVGGLIGNANGGIVLNTYASGAVKGTGSDVGGLVGVGGATSLDNFYDKQITGQAHSIGDISGGEFAAGETTAQMHQASTFANWSIDTTGAQGYPATTWRSYNGSTAPLLTYWLTPLAVAAGATTHVYDGTVHDIALGSLSYADTLAPGHVLGTPYYDAALNVGTYTSLDGLYSDQQGYDMVITNTGSLTITPAVLTAALTGVTKVYDGSTAATLTNGNYQLSGFMQGEGATVTQATGTYSSKNVAGATSASATLASGDFSATGSTLLSNYALPTTASGNASITPKTLTVGVTASDRVYDGTTADSVSVQGIGVLAGDVVSFSGLGIFADKNAGNGKAVAVSGITAVGADAGNYVFTTTGTSSASITPRQITVSLGGAVVKTSDGTTAATLNGGNFAVGNVVAGEHVNVTQTAGSYADATAGSGKTVAVSLIDGSYAAGANTLLSNYALVHGTISGPVGVLQPSVALTSFQVSLPNLPSGGDLGTNGMGMTGMAIDTSMADMQQAGADDAGHSVQEQSRAATVVSSNTRENLLKRRAFSIGDGGIRLPAGVRGSEKDASQ